MALSERARKERFVVLGFAVLALTAAAPAPSPALTPIAPWWERITYTISGDQEACQFESSLAGGRSCDAAEASSPIRAATSSTGSYAKITIERRFTPDRPDPVSLNPGDTLLGGRVMVLAIDATGAVRSCQVVGASGELRPAYGCDEARAERFEASAGRAQPQVRHAFMTILAYGHEEHLA